MRTALISTVRFMGVTQFWQIRRSANQVAILNRDHP